MNKTEIEKLYSQVETLSKFENSKKYFTGNDIVEWVAECVAIFSEINLNEEIISFFIKSFKPKSEEEQNEYNAKDTFHVIGPFKKRLARDSWDSSPGETSYTRSSISYAAWVAFKSAKAIIKKMEQEKRLIPNFLIACLSEKNEYTHIVSSLELMETGYQEKNSDSLFKNSTTLLDSILDLEGGLKNKKLSKKLYTLTSNTTMRNKFGASPDLIAALNNSRIIRNEKVVHKSLPLKYDLPFTVSLSFAYLVIFFLEISMHNGEIIK